MTRKVVKIKILEILVTCHICVTCDKSIECRENKSLDKELLFLHRN